MHVSFGPNWKKSGVDMDHDTNERMCKPSLGGMSLYAFTESLRGNIEEFEKHWVEQNKIDSSKYPLWKLYPAEIEWLKIFIKFYRVG
jgi:hypothetical protein